MGMTQKDSGYLSNWRCIFVALTKVIPIVKQIKESNI